MAVGAEGNGLIVAEKTFSVEATARPEGGFWRCGVHWVAEAKVVDGFTLEQVEILEAETKIVARRVHSDPSKRKSAQVESESKLVASLRAQVADLEKQLEEATKPPAKSSSK